jgi:hypothetical protein
VSFCINFIASSIRTARDDNESFKNAQVEFDDDQYDMYDLPDGQDSPDYDDFSETKVIPARHSEPRPAQRQEYIKPEPVQQVSEEPAPALALALAPAPEAEAEQKETSSWQGYYEPEQPAPSDARSALDALSALESELGSVDDYDVDAMLREYGFEDDNKG